MRPYTDAVDAAWQSIQADRANFLRCRMKNIALAQGTYKLPWWAKPTRELAKGPGRRASLEWLYT